MFQELPHASARVCDIAKQTTSTQRVRLAALITERVLTSDRLTGENPEVPGKGSAGSHMSKFRYLVVLVASLSAATFANAKSLPVKSIIPDPPSICDAAAGNLVANCGFELGLSDWTFTGNTSNLVPTGGPFETVVANSGAEFLAIGNTTTDGFMSQTLATAPGQEYNISWVLEVGDFFGTSVPNDFSVAFGNTPVFSGTDLAGTSSYVYHSVTAVATSASTTLKLGFRDDPDYLFLDDIIVNPVPEPGYFSVAGFILLALLFAQKRRLA
jgi:hypothetical protein